MESMSKKITAKSSRFRHLWKSHRPNPRHDDNEASTCTPASRRNERGQTCDDGEPTQKALPETDGPAVRPATVWTRDEDRLLLEQIKSGVNSNPDLLEKISDRFPDRRIADIEARIQFLLDFLNKLQNKS